MKKIVIYSLVLLAALAGCTKINQLENQPKEEKRISLSANLPEGTKVAFASNGAAKEGFTTSYDGNEHLFLWFEGKTLHYHELTVDSHTASSATFSGTLVDGYYPSDPSDYPIDYGAVVTSRALYSRGTKPWASYWFSYNNGNTTTFYNRVCLDQQNGTADMATAASVLFASGTIDDPGVTPTLSFNYLTSILKFVVTLPDGVVATQSNTEIYVGGENIYSYVWIDELTGALKPAQSSDANSYIYIVSSDKSDPEKAFNISGQTITGYVCLWTGASGLKVKNAEIEVVVDGTHTYKTTLAGETGSTLKPGKVYTFAPAGKLAFDGVTKWVNDAATTVNVPSSLTVSSKPTWMAYNAGTGEISIEANATGSPRQGVLEFTTGEKVDITQISVDDLAGSWNMHVYKEFAGTIGAGNAYASAAKNSPTNTDYAIKDENLGSYTSKTITIAKLAGESEITSATKSGIYQQSDKHTHNITIEGFSDPGLLVKAQAVINYEDRDAWVGLQVMQPFVSSEAISTPQHFSASGFSSYYAWLMPELVQVYANGTVKSWHFNFGTLGSDSKYWIDAKVSVKDDETTIYWDFADGNRPTLTTSTSYRIAGLMVNPFNASGTGIGVSGGPSASTLVRNISSVAKTGDNTKNAAWQYVYQGSIRMTK